MADLNDRLEYAEDGSVTLTLRRPLQTKDGEIGFLTLRRPGWDDFLRQAKAAGSDLDRTAWLLARLAGIDAGDFDTIDAADAILLAEVVGEFVDQRGDLVQLHADRIETGEDGATLRLRQPLQTKDGEVETVTLRRPNFREMRQHQAAAGGELAAMAKLISVLTGVGPLSLGQVDALDGLILSTLVAGFLASGRTSGGH